MLGPGTPLPLSLQGRPLRDVAGSSRKGGPKQIKNICSRNAARFACRFALSELCAPQTRIFSLDYAFLIYPLMFSRFSGGTSHVLDRFQIRCEYRWLSHGGLLRSEQAQSSLLPVGYRNRIDCRVRREWPKARGQGLVGQVAASVCCHALGWPCLGVRKDSYLRPSIDIVQA